MRVQEFNSWTSFRRSDSSTSSKAYLRILHLAAQEGESRVEEALRFLIREGEGITPEDVEALVKSKQAIPSATEIAIDAVNLSGRNT